MKMKICLFGFISIWLLFSLSARSFAVTHLVHPDGSGGYDNIQVAIDTSVDGDTVMLADGVFTGRGNINLRYYGKRIIMCSQSGNAEACTIDVAGEFNEIAERGFIFENNEDSLCLLKDITIIHGNADASCPGCEGAGIYIYYCSPTIINVICSDNYALNGAAIMCVGGSPIIKNCRLTNNSSSEGSALMCLDSTVATISHCLISGNHADRRGGGISIQSNCSITLENCTISNNKAAEGGGVASWESEYIIINSIISFNDSGASVYAYGDSAYTITYTDIFGNEGGDWIDIIDEQFGFFGNISANPLYIDTSTGNFHLSQNSPCINAGDPNSPLDPDTTIADMGAFYYDHPSAIEDAAEFPERISLYQNFPNPFNAQTMISYSLPEAGEVAIEIYNIVGQKVHTLYSGYQQAGNYRFVWNASEMASGVYFAHLKFSSSSNSIKMILLK
jgi:parallel beta-helix repeat protein